VTDRPLTGKVALVTGAGRGIGREIALRLARDGARLVVHYSGSEAGAFETVEAIRSFDGEAVPVRADIARRAEVQALFAAIDQAFGRLDIVVNSAGVSGGGRLTDLDDEQLEWLLGVNLKGPLYVASEAARRLARAVGSSTSARP
jgi:3-oxoacyl-[acyl-carrier protein] reductase